MKPQYFVPCNQPNRDWNGDYVGDMFGQPAPTRWRVGAHRCGSGGGPYQWFHQYYRCSAYKTCGGLNATERMMNIAGEVFRAPQYDYPVPDADIPGGGGLDVEEPDEDLDFLDRAESWAPPGLA